MRKLGILIIPIAAISVAAWAQSAQSIARTAFASTVVVLVEDAAERPISLGSGFIVADGLIVTNYHVVEGASGGRVKLIGRDTTYLIEGTVAADPTHDLVILRVAFAGQKPLPLGDSSSLQVGDIVYAVGSPLGMEGTFSQGIISGFRLVGSESLIQVTAPISQGSSGGPLLNAAGAVVGIAVATLEGGQNINFAIPVNYLKTLMQNASVAKQLSPNRDAAGSPGKSAYKVGDAGPAGGIVFFDKGKVTDGWRYLEACPYDFDRGIFWLNIKLEELIDFDLKTSEAVGAGEANTAAIVAAQGEGNYAAKACQDLVFGGYDDWFLPSIGELALLYKNLKVANLGGLQSANYWSSTQFTSEFLNSYRAVENYNFSGDTRFASVGSSSMMEAYLVRPVRSF